MCHQPFYMPADDIDKFSSFQSQGAMSIHVLATDEAANNRTF
jgi:hypothetical protein